jgi:hypothetical protein
MLVVNFFVPGYVQKTALLADLYWQILYAEVLHLIWELQAG